MEFINDKGMCEDVLHLQGKIFQVEGEIWVENRDCENEYVW